eukprot:IDg20683t1
MPSQRPAEGSGIHTFRDRTSRLAQASVAKPWRWLAYIKDLSDRPACMGNSSAEPSVDSQERRNSRKMEQLNVDLQALQKARDALEYFAGESPWSSACGLAMRRPYVCGLCA